MSFLKTTLYPLFRSSAIASITLGGGDFLSQQIEGGHSSREWDWQRTLRFAIVGATLQGPYFYLGFRQVDKIFGPQQTLVTAMKKTLTSQVTLFPVYLGLLFPYLTYLEGKSTDQMIQKTKDVWWKTFVNGAIFWPIANVINFSMFPPGTARVLFVGVSGVFWNCYVSSVNYVANEKTKFKEELEQERSQ